MHTAKAEIIIGQKNTGTSRRTGSPIKNMVSTIPDEKWITDEYPTNHPLPPDNEAVKQAIAAQKPAIHANKYLSEKRFVLSSSFILEKLLDFNAG